MSKMTIGLAVFVIALMWSSLSMAQTAEELEKSGLEHFGNAFYDAAPARDKARADDEYVRAEIAFREAIRKRPDRVDCYLHLGRTYFVQKKYAQAARVYREALTLAPNQKPIYLQLASALEMGGEYGGAAQVLKQLRTVEDNDQAREILDNLIKQLEEKTAAHSGGRLQ